MSYLVVDDNFADHPKIVALPDAAFRLHVTALCYAARHLTDGVVPRHLMGRKAQPLVDAGLWEPEGNGFRIHDYLDHNRSRAEVLGKRESERKRKGSPAESEEIPKVSDASYSDTKSKSKKTYSQPPEEVVRLCALLAELVEANGSKKPEVTTSWLTSARLMLEQDGRSAAEAEQLIRWSQADEFWRSNVLSMPTFRRQYDRLRLQMERPVKNGQVGDAVGRTLSQAAELRRRGL